MRVDSLWLYLEKKGGEIMRTEHIRLKVKWRGILISFLDEKRGISVWLDSNFVYHVFVRDEMCEVYRSPHFWACFSFADRYKNNRRKNMFLNWYFDDTGVYKGSIPGCWPAYFICYYDCCWHLWYAGIEVVSAKSVWACKQIADRHARGKIGFWFERG